MFTTCEIFKLFLSLDCPEIKPKHVFRIPYVQICFSSHSAYPIDVFQRNYKQLKIGNCGHDKFSGARSFNNIII